MKYLKKFNEIIGNGKYASYYNKSQDNFWGDIGGGCFVMSLSTGRILLPYRSQYVNEPNTWGIWGGKLDKEEGQSEDNVEDAVRREFTEESDFDGDIKLIPAFIFETPNKSFKYYNFIGLINNEFTPKLDWETESFKWVSFPELMSIEPKHFGLMGLLKDQKSLETIKQYSK